MLKLARYLKGFLPNVTIGPLCKLTEAVFELIVPLVMAEMIDVGIANNDESYIMQHGVRLILLAVCGLAFALVCQYMASVASQGVGTRLRSDLYKHINSLSHKELDDIGTSALVTRLTNDVNQVQTAVAMLIRLVVRAPFLVIGAAVMSLSISPRLSLIFLGAMAVIVLVMVPIMKATVKLFKKQQGALDGISRITRENLSGVRVVRAFSRQEHEKERFEREAEEFRKYAVRAGRINALLSPAIFVTVNIAYLLIVRLGGGFVSEGIDGLTQGKVIALVNYMTQISLALVVVANLVTIFTKAAASAARINEVFELRSSLIDKEDEDFVLSDSDVAAEFENVSFAYSAGDNAVENISFKLKKGETLGIIGGTGSGKSTLINLLCRFYDAQEGCVRVFGEDVKDYPLKKLRRRIALVPQKAELLSGSLRENMTMGREDISDEQIYKALEAAQAREFTDKLEGGLDARVLQGGKNFSGGQKQRLTIARAIAQGADILILDDSSSALDYATDAKLRAAVKKLEATVIIVSQRANSILHADNIIVLDDGRAEGMGTHAALLKSCPVYREICSTQYSKEELEKMESEARGNE